MASKTGNFNREYAAAVRRGTKWDSEEPRAISARYDNRSHRIVVELRNGVVISFPTKLAQGLRGALPRQLAAVEITPSGFGLHWEQLDADLSVPGLVQGVLGAKAWARELARYAGSQTSPRKAAASRKNGRKGGRPRTRASAPLRGTAP